MKVSNLSFPHPVLGIRDDVQGQYTGEYTVKLGRDTINLDVSHHLSNDVLSNLIQEHKAAFVTEIHCKQTFFRKAFDSLIMNLSIPISSTDLKNWVDVDLYVCSLSKVENYKLKNCNKDYAGYDFKIEPGDVLAYGGTSRFNAPKIWETSNSIAPFMVVEEYEQNEGPVLYELTQENIVIRLSSSDFKVYNEIKGSKQYHPVFHASLAYPALIYALKSMTTSDDYKESDWYQGVEDKLNNDTRYRNKLIKDLNEDEIILVAQSLLNNPIGRELFGLRICLTSNTEEEQEDE